MSNNDAYDNADRDTDLAFLAKTHGIETLETRYSDSLDFHELAVWQLKEMLEQAYTCGANAASTTAARRNRIRSRKTGYRKP